MNNMDLSAYGFFFFDEIILSSHLVAVKSKYREKQKLREMNTWNANTSQMLSFEMEGREIQKKKKKNECLPCPDLESAWHAMQNLSGPENHNNAGFSG